MPEARHTVTFTLNGREETIHVPARRSLLAVLREDLHLTGTKEGCGVGTCGACTVLLDGRPVLACLTLAVQVEGRAVDTVEGLEGDPAGRALQESFIRHDAFQCGFCTPGQLMVLAGLLRTTPRPTPDEIRRPWRATSAGAARTCASSRPPWRSRQAPPSVGVPGAAGGETRSPRGEETMPRIIRQKIEFEGRIEERDMVIEGEDLPAWPPSQTFSVVGAPVPRVDGAERVRGAARYTADLFPSGVVHGAVLRSPHAHARIVRLDTSRAERAGGVRLVLSHLNAPRIPWYNGMSWLFDEELRFAGDEVAVVFADDPESAHDALQLLEVEYEVLPHVLDAEEALREGAVLVHPAGNVLGGGP